MKEKIINNVVGGRYFVKEMIGIGATARVYQAKDIYTGSEYALKKYKTSNPNDKEKLLEGIERELDVLRYTTHPVLPKIFDLICFENELYLVMEYVEGINLKEHIKRNGRMKNNEIFHVMAQVCSGLYYLHSLEPPIVYRDLKPSNIILKEDGTVKLIDFGIAKRYSKEIEIEELAVGSKGFAAPEQFGNHQGKSIYNTDIRTDIYAVGATMYYLRTGKKYNGKISDRRVHGKLKKIVKKCTKTCPSERFQNCIELLCSLKFLA